MTADRHPPTPPSNPISRRALAVLVALVFVGGALAGAALAPAPDSSLADSSTIVQRVIALLAAQAAESSQANATASSTAARSQSASTGSAGAHTAHRKPKPASKAAPSKASTPSSPSESSTASESGAGSERSSAGNSGEGGAGGPAQPIRLPPIQHVWLVLAGGSTFATAATTAAAYPYLLGQLLGQGALLSNYSALDAYELAGDATLLPGGVGASLDVISQPGCNPAATSGGCTESAPPSPAEADAFVQRTVAPILAGPAYRENGLIVITFASASPGGGGPATTLAPQPTTGALLLSPLLHAGTQSASPFDSLSPRTSLQTIFRR